jgi:hypothetical protein
MGKKLFVCQTNTDDANCVVSILCPHFSEQGTYRRPKKAIFDNLQDLSTRDENITGFAEEVAWNDKDDADDDNDQCPQVQSADISRWYSRLADWPKTPTIRWPEALCVSQV